MKLHLADPYMDTIFQFGPCKLNTGLTALSKPELKALTRFQARSSELKMQELQGNNVFSLQIHCSPSAGNPVLLLFHSFIDLGR